MVDSIPMEIEMEMEMEMDTDTHSSTLLRLIFASQPTTTFPIDPLQSFVVSGTIKIPSDSGTGKGSGYNSIIPYAPGAESHLLTKALGEKIGNYGEGQAKAKTENCNEHLWRGKCISTSSPC